MGTKLIAKRAGTCPECGNTWKISENIFWDRAVKNSAGGNVTCSSENCFSKQGGTLTGFTPNPSYGNKGGYSKPFQKEYKDLTFMLPTKEDHKGLELAMPLVKQAMVRADILAGELYPNLLKTSDTYGQIRSNLADKLLRVVNHQ